MIPRKQLEDLGFNEIAEGLFMKRRNYYLRLYRDYRGQVPSSYAYKKDRLVSNPDYKEFEVIKKIEAQMSIINRQESAQT